MSDLSSQKFVSPRSLPKCLKFFDKDEALVMAQTLARFLRDSVDAMTEIGILDRENSYGMQQCFNLLLDELSIASGDYQFPLRGKPDDDDLCPRKEGYYVGHKDISTTAGFYTHALASSQRRAALALPDCTNLVQNGAGFEA